MKSLRLLFAAAFSFATSVASAQISYPMVMSLNPVAARVGETSECTVKSRYDLSQTIGVWVSGEGVTAEPVHPELKEGEAKKETTALKLKLTVAPDAAPGVREFRLSTLNGASTVGQLVIVRDPVIAEAPKNDTLDQAQAIELPAAVCGTIERNEDIDFFKFHAEAGQTLSFHVRSIRLQDKIHDLQAHSDPILFLRNASGSTIASSDNFFQGDPFVCFTFPQAGDYFLEIRDVRYQGNAFWEYCVEIHDRPFVTNVFPAAVAQGQTAELKLIGFNLGSHETIEWTAPADAHGELSVRLPLGDDLTDPLTIYVTDLPSLVETAEPHGDHATAQVVTLPVGISGTISTETELDYYRFTAKKGESYTFDLRAGRLDSRLDSIIRILDANGRQLIENDDFQLFTRLYSDSRIDTWTVPADGEYLIEIRDLHLRGGDDFVYFLAVTSAEPYFELYLDTDKTQINPGGWGVLFAKAVRKNGFTGGIQLHVDGLPEGVTVSPGRILPGKPTEGCLIFHAPEGVAPGMWNISVRGTAEHPMGEAQQPLQLVSVATPYEELYSPGGGRTHWPVLTHTIAVTQPVDLRSVKISTNELVLKPGETQTIDVTIERAEGFDKNVTLDMLFQHLERPFADTLPPGVTIDKQKSKTLLNGKEVQGKIALKAADTAEPVERQQCSVMANISLNFVMKWTYSSEPVFVTVLPKE